MVGRHRYFLSHFLSLPSHFLFFILYVVDRLNHRISYRITNRTTIFMRSTVRTYTCTRYNLDATIQIVSVQNCSGNRKLVLDSTCGPEKMAPSKLVSTLLVMMSSTASAIRVLESQVELGDSRKELHKTLAISFYIYI